MQLLEERPLGELFNNRDLSWLEFNRRVLMQAADERVPLLERVRFVAIFANNLDEFVMKRVGLLRQLVRSGRQGRSHDGMSPAEQLSAVRTLVNELLDEQARIWLEVLAPSLAKEGIRVVAYSELDAAALARLDAWYRANVFPVLTPLSVDPGQRFPFISNLSTSLGIMLSAPGETERHFARVKAPGVLPQLVAVEDPHEPSRGRTFITLQEIIANNLDDLFPGMEIHSVMPFRVTRSAAIESEDEEIDDLLEHVEEELRMRRFADVVRLEVPDGAGGPILDLIKEELEVTDTDIYGQTGPLDYTDLFALTSIDRPDLKDKPWTPVVPPVLGDPEDNIFKVIRERDILVHHPYESFGQSVERFVDAASRDPDVLAMKLTIYRTSPDSPFVASLIRAAESGKSVACLVELRARFDEQRNVRFARLLENAGVHVAYGVVGLKTHCKTLLVVRKEPDGLRCYAHLGTGNYHPHTAQLYTDLGLFTADPEITADVVALFNALTGRAQLQDYKRLVVAPYRMRPRTMELIDREIENTRLGRPARIIAKMNAMEDPQITQKLYEASRAGVQITLFVRGFCCLRPGVEGLSENIEVRSIVGRFLEHSRIFHFANAQEDPVDGDWYIGSADWMYRNLSNRVEAMTPVLDKNARQRLARIIEVHQQDRCNAWRILPDGRSERIEPESETEPGTPAHDGTFATLMTEALQDRERARSERR